MNQDISIEKMKEDRKQALVDILYLTRVTCLYLLSILIFPVGIIFGIIIKLGSYTDHAKRIGTVALILGLIGLGLFILILGFLAIIGVLTFASIY